jgi:hypothetical protein
MDEIEFLSFEGILKNIEVLKTRYQGFLSPFFNVERIVEWRDYVYSLPIDEWKSDRIWEYLNDDITLDKFKRIFMLR